MRKFLPLLAVVSSCVVAADDAEEMASVRPREEPSGAPYFLLADQRSVEALPLKEARAKVSIAGVIAHVRMTQVYANQGAQPIEAVYVFPGSTRSAVFGMEMKVGERTIVAEIAKRSDARARYEHAKVEGKSASLLEQERANVFKMNVANIMPGDRVEVRLDYTELLIPESGVYEFVLPTVVGPRFVGESGAGEDWATNPHLAKGESSTYRWELSARIAGGMSVAAVRSPSHRLSPRFDTRGNSEIEVFDDDGGNRDFILRYRLDGDRIETGMLLHEGETENFFAAIMQPPKRVAPAMIPPREYLFVVDVSGSMNGFPMQTAKALMTSLLERLRNEDRFNVLTFSGGGMVMAEASVPATRGNIDQARRIVDGMQGFGGTEILQALTRALSMPRSAEMSSTIIVITDGFVSVEREAFTLIREHLGDANLFAFGIGSSVNRHLIEGLAHQGLGRPFVVVSPDEAESAAERFRSYVESPVLTDVKLEFDGFDAYDVEPTQLPDLFSERPLVIMGKYRGRPAGTIRIRGTNGQGSYTAILRVDEFAANEDLVALRYLWARERIARLSDLAIVGDVQQEEITRLGLEHHLMTAFTSFIAVDSVVRNTGGRHETIRQPLPLPEGVEIGNATGLGGVGTRGGPGGGGLSMSSAGLGALGANARVSGQGGYGEGIGGLGKKVDRDINISAGSPIVMGSLDREIIRRIIKQHIAQIRHCYEKELVRNPGLFGKVATQFTIGANGSVESADVSQSTLNNSEVERCITAKIRSWQFPKPKGGGIVIVKYPFVFKTTRAVR